MNDFITESATFGEPTGKGWEVTMLREGFNKDRSRFYTESALRSFADLANAQSVPCMADHMSPQQFMQHPAGSVKEIVGGYTNVAYDPSLKVVKGELNFLEKGNPYPHIPEAIKESHERGMPNLYQISINARPGVRTRTSVNGVSTERVDSFTRITSTDLVTHGGAGGTIDAILENEGDNMTKEELEAAMKDLSPEELKQFVEENHPDMLQNVQESDTPPDPDENVTEDDSPPSEGNVTETDNAADSAAQIQEAVTAAIAPFQQQNAELRADLTKRDLKAQLEASGNKLPELVATRISNEIGDGRITESEALDTRIKEEEQIYQSLASVPAMIDFGTPPEGERGEDFLKKQFVATFKGEEYEGVKPLSGIHEMYARAAEMDGRRMPFVPKDVLSRQIIKESKNYDSAGMLEQLNAAGFGNGNVTESINMSSFGVLLGDSMNKAFLDIYAGVEELYGAYRKVISSFKEVNRFDEYPISRLGLYGRYPVVREGATYNPGPTVTEEAVKLKVVKYGRTEALTMEAIADDDLGKLQSIPQRLAHGGVLGRYRDTFDLITSNPYMPYDGAASDATKLFSPQHYNVAVNSSNDITAANLTSSNAYEAFLKMQQNRDQDSDETNLGIRARYILVPTGSYATAQQLYEQDYEHVPAATTDKYPETMNMNYAKGRMEPLMVLYWGGTSVSDSAWYLVGDPSLYDTIAMHYYTGHAQPQIETQDGAQSDTQFYTETLVIKSRDIRDQKVLDHRAFYWNGRTQPTNNN